MRASVLWSVALLSVTLGGCADPAPARDEPVRQAPPPLEAAWTLGQAWSPAPSLVLVLGSEAAAAPAVRPEGLEQDFYAPLFGGADPRIGDGQAAAWLVAFTSADRPAALEAILTADGTVVAQRERAWLEGDPMAAVPRDALPITPDIARLLDDLADGWLADPAATHVTWALRQEGGPVWTVDLAAPNGSLLRTFAFDGFNAAPLLPLDPLSEPLQRESRQGSGDLRVSNPVTIGASNLRASERLHLDDVHRELVADVAPEDGTTAPLLAVLVGPDGVEHALEGGHVSVPWPRPGLWQLNLTADGPGTTGYTFALCAPGDGPDQACQGLS